MEDFQNAFASYIQQEELWQNHSRLLLAYSGGLDSTVLAHLLHSAGFNFALAHVNFGLRAEADADEAFCKSKAAELGVPFYSKRFDTKAIKEMEGGSTQELARNLRYTWLEELRLEQGFDYLLTAHHQDDAFETLLLNFLRGTGIRGLRGMLPKREAIRRPLLFVNRKTLEDYATANQCTWREDSSNREAYYTRNKVRLQLMPMLRAIQPDLSQRMGTTLSNLQAAEYFYQAGIDATLQKLLQEEGQEMSISVKLLLETKQANTLLHEWLAPFGFSSKTSTQIADAARAGLQSDSEFNSDTHTLLFSGGKLRLRGNDKSAYASVVWSADQTTLTLPDGQEVSYEILSEPPNPLPIEPNMACLDAEVFRFPALWRHWKVGDKMTPLGMPGRTKKLQDMFVDLKLTRFEKERLWILEHEGAIVWIPNIRLSEKYKITQSTRRCIMLRWHH